MDFIIWLQKITTQIYRTTITLLLGLGLLFGGVHFVQAGDKGAASDGGTDKSLIINALANALTSKCGDKAYMECLGIKPHECYRSIGKVISHCGKTMPKILNANQAKVMGPKFKQCLQIQMQSQLKVTDQKMNQCMDLEQ